MKQLVKNYSFDKTTKEITFADLTTIDLNQILLVTNVTSNTIVYNFANPSLGGTVSGNKLTLAYNTGSMNNTDKLQIFIDVPDTATQDVTTQDLYNQMSLLLDRLEYGLMTDNAKQLYVSLARSGTLAAVTTVTTVSAVSALTNIARIGDFQAQRLMEAQLDTAFNTGIINNITF